MLERKLHSIPLSVEIQRSVTYIFFHVYCTHQYNMQVLPSNSLSNTFWWMSNMILYAQEENVLNFRYSPFLLSHGWLEQVESTAKKAFITMVISGYKQIHSFRLLTLFLGTIYKMGKMYISNKFTNLAWEKALLFLGRGSLINRSNSQSNLSGSRFAYNKYIGNGRINMLLHNNIYKCI